MLFKRKYYANVQRMVRDVSYKCKAFPLGPHCVVYISPILKFIFKILDAAANTHNQKSYYAMLNKMVGLGI